MIDPRELRIGNLITDIWAPEGSAFEVVLISSKYPIIKYGNNLSANCRNLQPIPLTEELLVKAGFEYMSWYDEEGSMQFCYNNKGHKITEYKGKFYYVLVEMKYLHQLQNLYWCLSGTELTIKLNIVDPIENNDLRDLKLK